MKVLRIPTPPFHTSKCCWNTRLSSDWEVLILFLDLADWPSVPSRLILNGKVLQNSGQDDLFTSPDLYEPVDKTLRKNCLGTPSSSTQKFGSEKHLRWDKFQCPVFSEWKVPFFAQLHSWKWPGCFGCSSSENSAWTWCMQLQHKRSTELQMKQWRATCWGATGTPKCKLLLFFFKIFGI